MEICNTSIAGIGNYLAFIATLLVFLAAFAFIYVKTTPYDEIANIAAGEEASAISFFGALLGFAIPLYSVMANSTHLLDMVIWGSVSLMAQLLLFFIIKAIHPFIIDGVKANKKSCAFYLAAYSVVIGLLNAGAVTY